MASHNSDVIFLVISRSFATANRKTMLRSLANDKVAVKCLTLAMGHTNPIVDQTKSQMTLYPLAAHCTYVNAIIYYNTNHLMALLQETQRPSILSWHK